jgi:MFS family permease
MSMQTTQGNRQRQWLRRSFGSYALLRGNRDLSLLFSGQVVSALGDWAYITALVILVYQVTGSATLAASLTFVRLLPYALFLPLGGVLADRFDRKRLMIIADLGRATCMVGLLAVHSAQTVWIAFPLVFVSTCLFSMFRPALSASIPDIAGGEENLVHANTLMGQVDGFAIVLGPSLAGVLLLVGHAEIALIANAVTYFVSTYTLLFLRLPKHESQARETANGWVNETLVGFRTIFGEGNEKLAAITLTSAGLCAFNGAFWTLTIVLADRTWHLGSQGAGFLSASFGGGALIGGLFVAAIASRLEISRSYLVALFGSVALIALFGLSPAGLLPFAVAIVFGAFDMFNQVTGDTMIQTIASPATLGRVFGAFAAIVAGSMMVGALITGPLIATIGPRATTVAFAAITLGILVNQLSGLRARKPELSQEPTFIAASEPL